MKEKNVAQIITFDGSALLAEFQINRLRKKPICLDVDIQKNISDYNEGALFYQIRKVVGQGFSKDLLQKSIFFVDFADFFRFTDDSRNNLFEALLQEGFSAYWEDSEEVIHYVPFDKSQSQAKDCVISFINRELFFSVRRRLDLDIGFNDYTYRDENAAPFGFPLENNIAQLSKLYAYRGLYLSEATRLDNIGELLSEERIVIIEDRDIDFTGKKATELGFAEYYTAKEPEKKTPTEQDTTQEGEKSKSKRKGCVLIPSVVNALDDAFSYKFTPFDGVGLISPRGAAILNRALYGQEFSATGIDPENTTPLELQSNDMAVSFQFRMPFCKGMLHTVDFHRFLREEMALGEDIFVTDIFGKKRNLKNADIILNQSLFKLCGLLKKDLNTDVKKAQFIEHYFQKLKDYDHSIYIVKTDKEQRYTGFGKLTAQILNTLPITPESFADMIRRHKERAQQYQLATIITSGKQLPILNEESKEIVHKYLTAEPYLALDKYVEELVNSCRKQALHRIYQGKLDVEGDMRFISRDLLYYMRRIGASCGGTQRLLLIPRGEVYLPRDEHTGYCALFRSPHLCPNENVLARTFARSELYETYLGHLHRVVFVASESQMPDALGGADFDGDMVVVAFQKEVVEACEKKCYREDGVKGLQLVKIPSLNHRSTVSSKNQYVNVDTIQNTFNSRIGLISNAAMRICAAESVTDLELPYSGKFCAILNGVEIDAAKTGTRPDLSGVTEFTGNLKIDLDTGDDNEDSFDDSNIAETMRLVKTYLKVSKELKYCDYPGVSISKNKKKYTVKFGDEEITHFEYEVDNAPFVYQLLIQWAEAFGKSDEEEKQLKQKAVDKLFEKLPDSKKTDRSSYPRKEILTRVVFACPDKVPAATSGAIKRVLNAYTVVKKAADGVQKNSDPTQVRRMQRNLLYVLRYKYDDIDVSEGNDGTLRQLGSSIGVQLEQELDTSEKLADALECNFYGADTDPARWMYREEIDKESPVGKTIEKMDPRLAQILCDKGFHGYDLLFFALRKQYTKALEKDFRQTLNTETGDEILDMFYEKAANAMGQGHSASYVSSKVLPQLCRKQLEIQLEEKDPNILIPLVYKQATDVTREAFWNMFSWEEIEAYLRMVRPRA